MFLAVAFGLFGLIIGSFLNVLVLRRGVRGTSGRSGCMSCQMQLAWRDLIPVVSWLILRGRCRSCGSAISIQYPLVEAGTAILFALIGSWASISLPYDPSSIPILADYLVIACLLIAIAAYDIRHTIIPDEWAYLFAALALLSQFLPPVREQYPLYLVLLSGPLSALPLYLLWLVSRGRWMGLGDSKLALGIGFLLGPIFGIVAVFFSFVVGALISLLILLPLPYYVRTIRQWGIARLSGVPKRFTMASEVPFGPFLITGHVLVWFALLFGIPLPLWQ